MKAGDVALVMRQPTTSFERISSCFLSFVLAQFATWNLVHYFFVSLRLAVLVPGVWVLLCVRKLDSSGDDFTSWVQCLVQQCIHVLRQYSGGFGRMYTFSTWRLDSIPEALLLHSV